MKRHAPATERNREPIAEVLAEELPSAGLVLEIASGTGEHAVHFARRFPHNDWQPSDPDPAARESIAAWREEAGLANLRAPIGLDASVPQWPIGRADAALCIKEERDSEADCCTEGTDLSNVAGHLSVQENSREGQAKQSEEAPARVRMDALETTRGRR